MNLRLVWGLVCVVASNSLYADDCLSSPGLRLRGTVGSRCETLQVDGRRRSYRLYVPAHLATPAPVVFVLHGGSGSGSDIELLTKQGFDRIADRDGVIVLYPDGVDRHWNDGRSNLNERAAKENVDDVHFLKVVLDAIAGRYAVDRQRVFATGMSNGGFMSYRLACEATDTFRAVVPVVAGLSVDLGPRCRPTRPISIAIMNGTEDPLVPWNGGGVSVLGIKRGDTWSAERTYEKWIELDACKVRFTEPEVNKVPDDETSLVRHRAVSCAGGTDRI